MSEDDPRLYLITPLLDDADAFAAAFVAALEAGDVACVLLRFAPTADAKAIARCLVPLAQQRGVACLIEIRNWRREPRPMAFTSQRPERRLTPL